jgi:hypothetical protein
MKQKYILGIYDKLINEIKYNRKTSDSEIIEYLKNCSNESHYLYKIKFSKQQGKIKYAYQKGIHNLHPYAPNFINSDCDINPEFEILIPIILKELNIPDSNLEFCWTEENQKKIVIIKQQCKIEEVSIDQQFFLYCFQMVYNSNLKIKEPLNNKFYSLKKEEEIVLYIHRKQIALNNLSKSLIEIINPVSPEAIYSFSSNYYKVDCLKIIYLYLEKLLIFIEKDYYTYLNRNNKVPYRSILVKELEIENKLNFVKARLLESNLNDDLLKLAYYPLLKIATIKIQKKITYNEFYYCVDYVNELFKHFQQIKRAVTESDIEDWLFELNFNSLEFFDYKTNEITTILEAMDSEMEKTDLLYHLLKKFNQCRDKNFRKLTQKIPSIKEQLISWVEEEIEYLRRKKNLDIKNSALATNSQARVKIQTNLSVAHFSYFNKLLMQADVISHNNNNEFFRFITDNYKTKTTENISPDSFKSKYHNVEANTVIAVKQVLLKLYHLAK